MPMVWIFKEKGIPKGEALVTYEDPQCVQAAIKWFQEHEFLGRKIEVKQAINSQRPVIIPPGGGGGGGQNNAMMSNPNMMNPAGSANTAAALAAAAVAAAASGNTMASLMNNSAAAAASLAALTGATGTQYDGKDYSGAGGRGGSASRGGRGSMTNGSSARTGGSNQAGSREGDWCCAQCCNINFSWREQCNRCHTARSQDMNSTGDVPGMPRPAGVGMPRGGGQGAIPVLSAGAPPTMPGFGRGGPVGASMPMAARGGRGGGPMRGSGVGVGRARPAPY
ncbi:RNA binding protein EWS [Fasciola gigantica]|uniref:RNA binding protein EWS n=1 Tax=Fasciola gigantica TaxID=46835 RepID=A0A504Y9D2_FASGI|nr:RNA binding protein EWS [Fasciola gigantica]